MRRFVKFIGIELFPYYLLNACKIFSDVLFFILDIGHLYLLFFVSLAKEVYSFYWFSPRATGGFHWFSPFFFLLNFIHFHLYCFLLFPGIELNFFSFSFLRWKLGSRVWDFSLFLIGVFQAVNIFLSNASAVSHKWWHFDMLCFSFLFNSKHFLIFLVTSPLTHWLIRSVLHNFQIFGASIDIFAFYIHSHCDLILYSAFWFKKNFKLSYCVEYVPHAPE